MTEDQMLYLILVVVAFLIFVGTLARVSFASSEVEPPPPETVKRHAEAAPKRTGP